jgi:hemerythrin-like domain-containing protein
MPKAIDRIQSDHRNAAALLSLMEQETVKMEAGEHTDFRLLTDIMHYFANYPDVYHHPLEDRIFDVLCVKDPDRAADVERIRAEHATMARASEALYDLMTQLQGNAVFTRDEVVGELRKYTGCYRRHMQVEEDVLLPAAAAALDAADWAAIEKDSAADEDPLFGKAINDQYRTLYRVILAEAGTEPR